MQPRNVFLRTLRIRNLLSYGDRTNPLELKPLNVLIGPNGSGKSNLLDVLGLLQAAPSDLTTPLRGDGIEEWLWKGGQREAGCADWIGRS